MFPTLITTESGTVYQKTYEIGDRLLRIRCAEQEIVSQVWRFIAYMEDLMDIITEERQMQMHSMELTDSVKENLCYLQDTIAQLEILVKDNPTLKVAVRRKL
jgi:hypothetical protein